MMTIKTPESYCGYSQLGLVVGERGVLEEVSHGRLDLCSCLLFP